MHASDPDLDLPLVYLARARECIDTSRAGVASAGDVVWVSAVGDAYRRELASLAARMVALVAALETAWDRVLRARWHAQAPP